MDEERDINRSAAHDSQITPQPRHCVPVEVAISREVPRDQESGNTAGCPAHGLRASFPDGQYTRHGGTVLDRDRGQIDPNKRFGSEDPGAVGQGSVSGCVDQSRSRPRGNNLDQERSHDHARQHRGHNNASKLQVQVRDTSTRAGSNDYTTNLVEAGGIASALDEGFARRARPRRFFTRGQVVRPQFDCCLKNHRSDVESRVFLTLWTEPNSGEGSSITGLSQTQYGETVHSKIRRFVVVTEADYHCTAVPIGTYGGKGVAKRGVNKSEHAIVHTGRDPPEPKQNEKPLRGEVGLLPEAIRINSDDRTKKLDSMSRLNLGKLYTIEHNVKVCSFGHVHPSSLQPLMSQFKKVWAGNMGIDQSQASTSAAHSRHDSLLSPVAGERSEAELIRIACTELAKLGKFTPGELLMLTTRLAPTADDDESRPLECPTDRPPDTDFQPNANVKGKGKAHDPV